MKKEDLRNKYKNLRTQLSTEDIEKKSIQIANQLLKIDIWNALYYHLFLSIEEQKEINTEFILNILFAKNKEVVISKSNFETLELTNYLLTENTKIKKNKYNIPEPIDGIEVPNTKIDVVFIPLLCYDEKGNRIGYGKGFYDSFLTNCKPECLKIGISFFEPEIEISNPRKNDIPLDYCITPNKIHHFNHQ